MERPNTVSGLLEKRAELLKVRKALEAELRGVVADLDHLDACIRLFDPSQTPAARKRYATKHRARRGQMQRFVLATLRGAAKPLTSREIGLAWMSDRGLKTDDSTAVLIRKRVGACLNTLKHSGVVTKHPTAGDYDRWSVSSSAFLT